MRNIDKHQYRYQIISLAAKGFFTVAQAARELNISERHIKRLLAAFRKSDKSMQALLPKARPQSWNGTTQKIIDEIIRLKKERPSRANQHIAELVENKFGENVSRETIRRVLLRNDCYENVPRERRSFKILEEEITGSGQMVQMDTCEGAWLKGYRRIYLIAAMDAFSRYIVGWRWVDSDSAWNNILVLRSVIEQYGVPEILYTDNASFFKVIRHNQSRFQRHKPGEEYETTIERIMLELGGVLVTHKPYEPQGKGRIERFFRFMQDRFILEHTATTLDELNRQFKKWVRWYHTKHIIRTIRSTAKDRFYPEGYRPVPEDLNLDKVFSYQYTRTVDKYNSASFEGQRYVIHRKNCGTWGCFVGFKVQIYVTDKEIAVYYGDHLVQKFRRIAK